MNRRTCD